MAKRIATAAKKTPATREIPARKTLDAQFLALLRRKCMRAASIGAVTAAVELLPGLGSMLRLIFGEVLDAKFLGQVQRELVEETFALYEVRLPRLVKNKLVEKVQLIGTGASITGDVVMRATLKRVLGRFGGFLAARALPLLPMVTSAATNAAVTYAIGKRAQAVARLRNEPLAAMPDAVRAFTGIDERRIYAWSSSAVKSAFRLTGGFLGRIAGTSPRKKAKRRAKS
jgi:hypothetical protein